MARPLSPIHRPLDPVIADLVDPDENYLARGPAASLYHLDNPPPSPPTRIARLAALDSRKLAGTERSLGPGGASAVYEQAVRTALVDEMVDQLRVGHSRKLGPLSEVHQWAAEIIAAFKEE